MTLGNYKVQNNVSQIKLVMNTCLNLKTDSFSHFKINRFNLVNKRPFFHIAHVILMWDWWSIFFLESHWLGIIFEMYL